MIEYKILYSVFRENIGRHWLTDFEFGSLEMSFIRPNRREGVRSDRRKKFLKVWSRVGVRMKTEL